MGRVMTSLVDVKRFSVIFQHKQHSVVAVDKLNFSLTAGQTTVLLGESGCGKTLTASALMRLLPGSVVYGQRSAVVMGDEDILDLSEKVMRSLRGRRLAMIFQEPMTALNPVLTIRYQLSECVPKRPDLKAYLVQLLTEVELPDPLMVLDKYPHQLSGGQKQRVMIAMALAGRPEVLIADEPTTALDVTIQAQILALLKKLQRQYQMSILLITHDLGVVRAMADRVCVMYAGQMVEMAGVEQFFQQPMHPYSQQLLSAVPSFHKRDKQLYTIIGQVPALGEVPQGCRVHPRCAHAFALCAGRMPCLQKMPTTRAVRCHLYPKLDRPPELIQQPMAWRSTIDTERTLLSVQNLTLHYQDFTAVDGLSFDIGKGKVLALVGESGCGKTTVCRALVHLLAVTSGDILYAGESILSLRRKARKVFRKKVQMIFQDPASAMNPKLTVNEILCEGLLQQNLNRASMRKRILELLDQVQMPQNALYRYPHQFSGGQRQRICIARALATCPELLICDEPTSSLDVSVQAQILNLLRSLQYELGLTYLFITHNMGVVSYVADDILVMRAGKAVEYGPCEEILQRPQEDYTKLLLKSVLMS